MITRLGRAEFSSTAGGHGPPMGHASTMDGESGVLASEEKNGAAKKWPQKRIETSLLGRLAQRPVENVASAVVPIKFVR